MNRENTRSKPGYACLHVAAAFAVAITCSCTVEQADLGRTSEALQMAPLPGINLNGINLNGINLNGINLNGINLNGINLNGINLNSLALDGLDNIGTIAGLSDHLGDPAFQQVLRYLIEGALPAGETVKIQGPDGPLWFDGKDGIAPCLHYGGCDETAERLLTAYLCARSNTAGWVNVIYTTMPNGVFDKPFNQDMRELPVDLRGDFDIFEGACMGNIFQNNPELYYVTGSALTAPRAVGRACGGGCANGCGLDHALNCAELVVGTSADVCAGWDDVALAPTGCKPKRDGRVFDEVVAVHLAPRSPVPEHVPNDFGLERFGSPLSLAVTTEKAGCAAKNTLDCVALGRDLSGVCEPQPTGRKPGISALITGVLDNDRFCGDVQWDGLCVTEADAELPAGAKCAP